MKKLSDALTSVFRSSKLEVYSVEELREEMSWEAISCKVPRLPRGWYELVGLTQKDRLDFFKEYWLTVLGIDNNHSSGICRFFSLLDSLDVYVYRYANEPYNVRMFYTFDHGHFGFQGNPPLLDTENLFFPNLGDRDYVHFFGIHNGFGKWEDEGIFSYRSLAKVQYKLRELLIRLEKISPEDSCASLGIFPFYGYEEPLAYQCFLVDREVRRDFPSPNVLLSEESLAYRSLESLEISHLTTSQYSSFLLWLEDYLLAQ
ncbi:hypothetical protein BOKEGFJH_00140 [Chlamydia avium]|uniref:Uncharacterized protein n=2 Tax=Chlamydia avium TaxID=1457141 RepID=W8JL46_9CHLA|nr:hypothetical protein [Chlamydia avium]AHK63014.1 Uncharacterized protein M832_01450 [Chlamydia avium 10DC88]EPP35962.1 hypothetical protein CP10743SC13_0468 [Chlamydia psittaci 10_743_SC13]EPP38372.1 hypothetical protein CP10881SC42_0553 [Chlamydia avium]VVT42630.1 hypothetical protein BOKEGFJH_00140 [Chlamydia avium]